MFTWKAVVDEIFVWDSTNWCETIVGIDASQFYSFSMCQAMVTGLYTRWEPNSESENLNGVERKQGVLKTWLCHFFSELNHSV